MLRDFEQDLATGAAEILPCDMDLVLSRARSVSLRKTTSGGHRTLDILHIATAVHLGARDFLTFDARQKALAHFMGLETPLG